MDASFQDMPRWAAPRLISGLELALGAAIVVGHNVFRVLPNEVPILFLAGLISFRLRNGGWAAMGFRRPDSWLKVIGIAVAAAALRLGLGEGVIVPLTAQVWPAAQESGALDANAGDLMWALTTLGLVWTFAAFGEEIGYRGYLMNRAADLGRRTPPAYWIAAVVTAVLFGYGHFYKGPAGVLDSGVAGLILAGAYILSGRNLWTCVLAHGLIDTIAVGLVYSGLAD